MSNKKKFLNDEEFRDKLLVEGINSMGYGIVPKSVMQDQRLTRDSKAIYAYFCSFAGAGTVAFPSVSLICHHLGFGKEETFRKHLNLLKKYDYIRVKQKRDEKGKWNSNIYTLITNPNPVIEDENEKKNPIDNEEVENTSVQPSPQKGGDGENKENLPYPPFEGDGEKGASVKRGYPENGTSVKRGTNNNNNNNNNSFNNNSLFNNNNVADVTANNKIDIDFMKQLKKLECKHNSYSLTDKNITRILKTYSEEIPLLKNIINYITNTEPKEGYSNIVGAIIAAKNWDIDTSKLDKKNNTKKTKFHTKEGRTQKYSAEELEDFGAKKRNFDNKDEVEILEADILERIKCL